MTGRATLPPMLTIPGSGHSSRHRRPTARSGWVPWPLGGIGGAQSADLIQAGVEETTVGNAARYQAWYETLPQASRSVLLDVGPGDCVLVNIHEVAWDLWQINIVDGSQVVRRQLSYRLLSLVCRVDCGGAIAGQWSPLAAGGVTGADFANMAAIANGAPALPTQLSPFATAIVSPPGQVKSAPGPLGLTGQASAL